MAQGVSGSARCRFSLLELPLAEADTPQAALVLFEAKGIQDPAA